MQSLCAGVRRGKQESNLRIHQCVAVKQNMTYWTWMNWRRLKNISYFFLFFVYPFIRHPISSGWKPESHEWFTLTLIFCIQLVAKSYNSFCNTSSFPRPLSLFSLVSLFTWTWHYPPYCLGPAHGTKGNLVWAAFEKHTLMWEALRVFQKGVCNQLLFCEMSCKMRDLNQNPDSRSKKHEPGSKSTSVTGKRDYIGNQRYTYHLYPEMFPSSVFILHMGMRARFWRNFAEWDANGSLVL